MLSDWLCWIYDYDVSGVTVDYPKLWRLKELGFYSNMWVKTKYF